MAQNSGKRALKMADKEAEVILASMHRASEAAVETTLAGIVEKLKQNVPLMYHIAALLNNEEWTAVLEASLHSGGQAPKASGDKPEKVWKLRTALKKFGHLDRHVRLNQIK